MNIPFPQANNLETIFLILDSIDEYGIDKSFVSENFGLTDRECSYYLDALRYIALIEKLEKKYYLSDTGELINSLDPSKKRKYFARYIITFDKFSDYYKGISVFDTKKDALNYLSEKIYLLTDLGKATSDRRASTVYNWFEWIDRNVL